MSENTDDATRLRAICKYLEKRAQDELIVLPIHPRTRARLIEFDLTMDGVRLIGPVGYFDMHRLLQGARLVYTDSGGLQKEAYFLRVPCVTLRNETEWPETLDKGWNVLAGANQSKIIRSIKRPPPKIRPKNAFGDGNASRSIVNIIKKSGFN